MIQCMDTVGMIHCFKHCRYDTINQTRRIQCMDIVGMIHYTYDTINRTPFDTMYLQELGMVEN